MILLKFCQSLLKVHTVQNIVRHCSKMNKIILIQFFWFFITFQSVHGKVGHIILKTFHTIQQKSFSGEINSGEIDEKEVFNMSSLGYDVIIKKKFPKNMKVLDLSNNELTDGMWSKLDPLIKERDEPLQLVLSNNKLENFSSSIVEISELNLDDNNLTEIKIKNSIKRLSASSNNINKIECENSTIEILNLSNNNLTANTMNCLSEYLIELDLSKNTLGKLESETFAEMKNLTNLNLSNTNIAPISANLFSHNKNIKSLDISNNNLHSLDLNMFLNLSNLEVWDLSGNNLTKLKNYEKFSDFFPKLRLIGIDNNAFKNQMILSMESSFKKQNITLIREVGFTYEEPKKEAPKTSREIKDDLTEFKVKLAMIVKSLLDEIQSSLKIYKIIVIILFILQILMGFFLYKLFIHQRRMNLKSLMSLGLESTNTLESNIHL